MTALIAGLVVFLGVHSVRIFADDWRSAQIARRGEGPWKGLYSLASAVGLVLIVWGLGQARNDPGFERSAAVARRRSELVLTSGAVKSLINCAGAFVRAAARIARGGSCSASSCIRS